MFLLCLVIFIGLIFCCTDFLVSPGASEDGSAFVTYNADSHTLYGVLYHFPAGPHKPGEMLEVYEWDSGKYLGKIPQANYTYNVVGNMNEFQVTVGETTFGGIGNLTSQPDAIIDYGSLMWITLQRSRTAREAIMVMSELVGKFGYASEGESFSVGDPTEVWHVEMISKGSFELGAVWVAMRVPDGYIGAHANQARIQKFPLDDPENCLYSPDVITFAQKHGFYTGSAKDFSFSDVYNPVGFDQARWGEARVWDFFNHATNMSKYLDYVQGINLKNRMPLFIKPDKKISLEDMMTRIRSHFEGTWFDMAQSFDFGSQPYNVPYRWRPLIWEYGGKQYVHERAIATQQTGFTFIGQMRKWLPDPIGGVFWFGVDDTGTTVYAPMYCSMTKIPWAYDQNNGAIMEFTFESMFWINNMVAHHTYSRFEEIYPEVRTKIDELEGQFIKETASVDQQALDLYKKSPESAVAFVTNYSVQTGTNLHQTWTKFYGYIFSKYLDGDTKKSVPGQKYPHVDFPGYNSKWLGQIVKDSGDHFLYRGNSEEFKNEPKGI